MSHDTFTALQNSTSLFGAPCTFDFSQIVCQTKA